jgi:hypothetical protein
MRPYRPDVLKFSSSDKKLHLSIPLPPDQATLHWREKKYDWLEIKNPNPKLVLFNEKRKTVIFLGGLGDPGSHLGVILVHSLTGELLHYLDIKEAIPKLEKMSQKWGQLNNFPWLAAVELSKDGLNLALWVCARITVGINLETYSVETNLDKDDKAWQAKELVYNKGMSA